MPLAAETLMFAAGGSVTLIALKLRGTSVTVSSLVLAITVRVASDGSGAVCAAANAAGSMAPRRRMPTSLNSIVASQADHWHHQKRSSGCRDASSEPGRAPFLKE